MAVTLKSFTANSVPSSFLNTTELYYDVLNGGNVGENVLEYTFTITGILGHTLESISFDSLLFNANGSLKETANCTLELFKDRISIGTSSGAIACSSEYRKPFNTKFNVNSDETQSIDITLKITCDSECYYGLASFTYTISDLLLDIKVNFTGPLTGRTVQKINCATIVLAKGTEVISFSKNPLNNFDSEQDNVQGRMYLRKDGIYVDGFQYAVNGDATTTKKGIVKLLNTFELDKDGGIIAPTDVGVAASPQLVYNTIGNLKLYVDDNALKEIKIQEDNSDKSLKSGFKFSLDFKEESNIIYLNWKEYVNSL